MHICGRLYQRHHAQLPARIRHLLPKKRHLLSRIRQSRIRLLLSKTRPMLALHGPAHPGTRGRRWRGVPLSLFPLDSGRSPSALCAPFPVSCLLSPLPPRHRYLHTGGGKRCPVVYFKKHWKISADRQCRTGWIYAISAARDRDKVPLGMWRHDGSWWPEDSSNVAPMLCLDPEKDGEAAIHQARQLAMQLTESRKVRLTYESDFDENGAIYWIGTKGKTQSYQLNTVAGDGSDSRGGGSGGFGGQPGGGGMFGRAGPPFAGAFSRQPGGGGMFGGAAPAGGGGLFGDGAAGAGAFGGHSGGGGIFGGAAPTAGGGSGGGGGLFGGGGGSGGGAGLGERPFSVDNPHDVAFGAFGHRVIRGRAVTSPPQMPLLASTGTALSPGTVKVSSSGISSGCPGGKEAFFVVWLA